MPSIPPLHAPSPLFATAPQRHCLAASLVSLACAALTHAHAATPAPHLCAAGEQVVFACAVKGKRVSVCATPDARANRGTLTYRFGSAAASPELQLPDAPTPPAQAAQGAVETFASGGGAWLRFAKGAYTYTVFTGVGRWGPQGQVVEREGVLVERQGKTVAHLPCTATASSQLSPDWYERMGIQPGDQEFAFP